MAIWGGVIKYSNYADYAVHCDTTATSLFTEGYQGEQHLVQEQIDLFNQFEGSNLTKHLKYEIAYRLPAALMRQDKMTMAHSIENRVPLLDNKVVDFVMALPEDMLIRFMDISPVKLSSNPFEWVQGKIIFKEILARHFGKAFVYRKKDTMAQSINEREMLASQRFRQYYHEKILPRMKTRGLVDAKKVDSWYSTIRTISQKDFICMWRAIGLETWCQLFLD